MPYGEKKVLELLQAVLLNIIESKGGEREQTISTFKEKLGINASLLQKVSFLIRKAGLILKGRSLNNKFKISQRQLRSLLTGVLGTVVTCGRFNLPAHLQGVAHPSGQRLFLHRPDPHGHGSVCLVCFQHLSAIPRRGSGTWQKLLWGPKLKHSLKTQHLWCHSAEWLLLVW